LRDDETPIDFLTVLLSAFEASAESVSAALADSFVCSSELPREIDKPSPLRIFTAVDRISPNQTTCRILRPALQIMKTHTTNEERAVSVLTISIASNQK
jgi:hypothetical protein